MLFLRCEQKWDEVMYCDLFFTLKNHPEWQKDCGINMPPSNPFMLSLEKEKNKKGDNKLKRCCSACSIGQRCLKLYEQEREDDTEMIIGSQRAPPRTAPRNSDEREPMNSPVAGRTRAKQSKVIQAPLPQALGTEGVATIKVPFSIVDLNNWKIAAGSYRENPDQTAHAFETMIQTQDPDWKDRQVIMNIFFDSTERDIIRRVAKTQVEAQVASGVL